MQGSCVKPTEKVIRRRRDVLAPRNWRSCDQQYRTMFFNIILFFQFQEGISKSQSNIAFKIIGVYKVSSLLKEKPLRTKALSSKPKLEIAKISSSQHTVIRFCSSYPKGATLFFTERNIICIYIIIARRQHRNDINISNRELYQTYRLGTVSNKRLVTSPSVSTVVQNIS